MTSVGARGAPRRSGGGAHQRLLIEIAGRVGLVARGVLYIAVGVLALQIAFGNEDESANRKGALETVAHQPFGRGLVTILAVGFAAYALWRFALALLDVDDEDEAKGWAKRAANAGRGVLYSVLCWSAIGVLRQASKAPAARDGQSPDEQDEWTARVFAWPGGRSIVVIAGLVLIGAGVYHGLKASRGKWKQKLDLSRASPTARRAYTGLANFGLFGRGAVHALIGLFLARAAWRYDPNDAVGVDGALRRLADRPWGPWMLSAVAFGLLAFGLYSIIVEARFRRVPQQ